MNMRVYKLFRMVRQRPQILNTSIVGAALLLLMMRLTADKGDVSHGIQRAHGNGAGPIPLNMDERLRALEEHVEALKRRFWLESLEPIFQFRPKFWLDKTSDVEDKDQIEPFFLANYVDAIDPTVYKRRIYIDLGIKDFDSSLCWIMRHYPVKFDMIYGFECAADYSDVSVLNDQIDACIAGSPAEARGYATPDMLHTMKIFHNFVGLDDSGDTSPATVGFSNFIRSLNIREDDFVVVKIDIEGVEYDLIDRILSDGVHKLLDEVFVEMHYRHPDMAPWGWDMFEHSRSDAQAMFTKARDAGMFIHPWP